MNDQAKYKASVELRDKHGNVKKVNHPVVCIVTNSFVNTRIRAPIYDLERKGLDRDLETIRATFKKLGFNVPKEFIIDKNKEDIFIGLQNIRYHYPKNQRIEIPDVLILFIMSHGDENGVIYTDYTKSSNKTRDRYNTLTEVTDMSDFDSYTTQEVFDKLNSNDALKSCFKLIVIQACRGKFFDEKYPEEVQGPINQFRVQAFVPPENSIVVYSSVESFRAYRNKKTGSILVQPLCNRFKKAASGDDILTLITATKSKVCKRSIETGNKQTPEVVYNAQETLVINVTNQEKMDYSKFVHKWEGDIENVTGCAAFVKLRLFDQNSKLLNALERNMGLHVDLYDEATLQEAIDRIKRDSARKDFMMIFVACKLVKGGEGAVQEVCLNTEDVAMPIGDVIKRFLGTNNEHMEGKPKFFFFIDASDGQAARPVRFPLEPDDEDSEVATTSRMSHKWTQHSFNNIFVCYGADDLENLIETLKSPEMRQESTFLEMELARCVRLCNKNRTVLPELHTTFMSTMPVLVNLPSARHAYVAHRVVISKKSGFLCEDDGMSNLVKLFLPDCKTSLAWILEGLPGQGKTRFAKRFERALRVLSRKPSDHIIYASLSEHSQYFEKCLSEATEPSIKYFHGGKKPSKTNRLAFVFDGYERVAPFFKDVLQQLFEKIYTGKHSLLVTTRSGVLPGETDTLKFSYAQLTFESDSQCKFLKQLNALTPENALAALISLFPNFNNGKDFMDNPLHLKKIIQVGEMKEGFNRKKNFAVMAAVFRTLVIKALSEFEDVDRKAPRLAMRIKQRQQLLIAVFADLQNHELREQVFPKLELTEARVDKIHNTGLMQIDRKKKTCAFNYPCMKYFLYACAAHAFGLVAKSGKLINQFKPKLRRDGNAQYIEELTVNCRHDGGKTKYPMLVFGENYKLE